MKLVKILLAILLLSSLPSYSTVYFVTDPSDTSFPGTLREGLIGAQPGDTIQFSVPTGTVFNISSPLIVSVDSIVINGDINADLLPDITIQGSGASAHVAFDLNGRSGVQILNVNFINALAGVNLLNSNNIRISGCFFGTNLSGNVAAQTQNLQNGILCSGSCNSLLIGDTTGLTKNLFAGITEWSITLNGDSNIVAGNHIGCDANAEIALGGFGFSSRGIQIAESSGLPSNHNQIGWPTIDGRNYIFDQIASIYSENKSSVSNVIINNHLGVISDTILSTSFYALGIQLADSLTEIGNGTAEGRNVITNSSVLANLGYGTIVKGNYFGTNAFGEAGGTHLSGIVVNDFDVVIGGKNAGEGNVISGCSNAGITISINAQATILNNIIGLSADQSSVIPNNLGIQIVSSDGVLVGDGTKAGRNIITGNISTAIRIDGSNAVINNNLIGINQDGQLVSGQTMVSAVLFGGSPTLPIRNDSILNNTIVNLTGSGIQSFEMENDSIVILNNLIQTNTNQSAIDLGGGQGGLLGPVSAVFDEDQAILYGDINSAEPNALIQLFADSSAETSSSLQANYFIGETISSTDGSWSFDFRSVTVPDKMLKINATQTYQLTTSPLSFQFIPPCENVWCLVDTFIVASTTPNAHALGVDAGIISIKFNSPINPSSISNIHVVGSLIGNYNHSESTSDSTLIITVSESFAVGEHIRITLPNTLMSQSGRLLHGGYNLEFWADVPSGFGKFDQGTIALADTGSSDGLTLADFDSDGDLDAFFCNDNAPDEVWLNNGDATFVQQTSAFPDVDSRDVIAADFDNDGDMDVFIDHRQFTADEVWLNNGDATFIFSESHSTSNRWGNAQVADWNADGFIDVIYRDSGGIYVLTNDGDGTFTETHDLPTLSSGRVQLGDFNNDGHIDFFASNRNGDGNEVFMSNGDGAFVLQDEVYEFPFSLIDFSTKYSITSGDFNKDGFLDILEGVNGENVVWLNDGDGTFTANGAAGGAFTWGVAAADFRGVDMQDVYVANAGGISNRYFENDGFGNFTQIETFGNNISIEVKAGDLDGDGDLDVFVGNGGSNVIYLNGAIVNAFAGSDQFISQTEFTLNAAPIATGEIGLWTDISGTLTFDDTADNNATVSGFDVGVYELIWKVSNGTDSAADTILITVSNSIPSVIESQHVVNTSEAVTSISASLLFNDSDDNIDPTSMGIVGGPFVLDLTDFVIGTADTLFEISPSNMISTNQQDSVLLKVCDVFNSCDSNWVILDLIIDGGEEADAGDDIQTNSFTVNLGAVTPLVGNGYWSLLSSFFGVEIDDSTDENTRISGLSPGTSTREYDFLWTLDVSGNLTYDTMTVTVVNVAPFVPDTTVTVGVGTQVITFNLNGVITDVNVPNFIAQSFSLFDGPFTGELDTSIVSLNTNDLTVTIDLTEYSFWTGSDSVIVEVCDFSNGCTYATFKFEVESESLTSATLSEIEPVIYNAVSPNGDDYHAYFKITYRDNVTNIEHDYLEDRRAHLTIYSSWGDLIYESEDYTVLNEKSLWIGQTNKNEEAPEGTYFYVVEFFGSQSSRKPEKADRRKSRSGFVVLKR